MDKMLRSIENKTENDIVITEPIPGTEPVEYFTINFEALSSTLIFRNYSVFSNPAFVGKLVLNIDNENFGGLDFNNEDLTDTETKEMISLCASQTQNGEWNEKASLDLLRGMALLLNAFDFTSSSVNKTDTIDKLSTTLMLLHCEFLEMATEQLKSITPDVAGNFLTLNRLNNMIEVFELSIKS